MSKPTDDAGDGAQSPDFRKELTAAFQAAIASQQPAAAPQALSQEQLHQMLGHWRPDAAWMKNMFGEGAGEAHQTGFEQFMTAMENMIERRADVIARGVLADYHGSISPYLDDARHVSGERFQDALYSGEGAGFKQFKQIFDKMLPQMQAEADYPRDRSAQIPYLHGKFAEFARSVNPNFDPKAAASAPPASPAKSPVAPLPSFGGGAGSSGGSGAKPRDYATATEPMSLAEVLAKKS